MQGGASTGPDSRPSPLTRIPSLRKSSARKSTSPRVRRAVRGKSGITGAPTIGMGGWSAPGRRRTSDIRNRSRREEEVGDEFGKPERQGGDTMGARCNAQQQIGDHGGEDLQPDGIVVFADELADVEMLLDPAEQKLDLPATLVESGDLDGTALKVVGEESDGSALV